MYLEFVYTKLAYNQAEILYSSCFIKWNVELGLAEDNLFGIHDFGYYIKAQVRYR